MSATVSAQLEQNRECPHRHMGPAPPLSGVRWGTWRSHTLSDAEATLYIKLSYAAAAVTMEVASADFWSRWMDLGYLCHRPCRCCLLKSHGKPRHGCPDCGWSPSEVQVRNTRRCRISRHTAYLVLQVLFLHWSPNVNSTSCQHHVRSALRQPRCRPLHSSGVTRTCRNLSL